MNIDNNYCKGPGCTSEMCSVHWVLEFRERREHRLYWTSEPEGRWHVDGRGIHAGAVLELELADVWIKVRIESSNGGRNLVAYYDRLSLGTVIVAGATSTRTHLWPSVEHRAGTLERFDVVSRIFPREDRLRWPGGDR